MPACVSSERRAIIAAFRRGGGPDSGRSRNGQAIARARELAAADPKYFMPDQFRQSGQCPGSLRNDRTGDFPPGGREVDVFVAGLGTGGTLMGAGEYLKAAKPGIKIFGVEPLPGHRIQGLKNMSESEKPSIFNRSLLDGIIAVDDEEAFVAARELVTRAGVFAGLSSGAAVAGARKIAADFPGAVIATVLPDRGERYLSTEIFRSYCGRCRP